MSSFTRRDYRLIFEIGAELYDSKLGQARRRQLAVTLMHMAEECIGQQDGWPRIHRSYRGRDFRLTVGDP